MCDWLIAIYGNTLFSVHAVVPSPSLSPSQKTIAEEWFQDNSVRTTNLICHAIIIEIEIIVLSMSYKITIIIIIK